jgi:phage/plasmid-associated DNA primase
VVAATHEYEADSDPLRDFLEQACELDPDSGVGANDLYEHYAGWAQRAHLGDRERLTATMFGRRMAERFTRRKTARGWFYSGVARL